MDIYEALWKTLFIIKAVEQTQNENFLQLMSEANRTYEMINTHCTCPLIDDKTMGFNPNCPVHKSLANGVVKMSEKRPYSNQVTHYCEKCSAYKIHVRGSKYYTCLTCNKKSPVKMARGL